MELDRSQPITTDAAAEAASEAMARQSLASAPTPTRESVVVALRDLLADGWVCFQDLARPGDGGDPLSFVLVGAAGTVVVETASSIGSSRRDRLAAGAGFVAANLSPCHRGSVRSVLVIPDDVAPNTDLNADSAAIEAVTVSGLAGWLRAFGTALDPAAVSAVADQLRNQVSPSSPSLLTTADLLPVGEGQSERELHRPAAPAEEEPRPKTRLRRRGPKHARAQQRAERARINLERPDFTRTDLLRVIIVTITVLVGVWFWGVLSDVASGADANMPVQSPVTSSQSADSTSNTGTNTPAADSGPQYGTSSSYLGNK